MRPLASLILPAAALGLLALTPSLGSAQISFEVRGGLQYPTGNFDEDVDGNAGFAADVFYGVSPRLAVYGGYGIENFDEDVESSGFEAGVKYLLRSERDGVLPWIRGGGILHELEVPGGASSERGVGFQISGGADIPLGEVVSFSPALRYQSYSPDFDTAMGDIEDTVGFLSLDFGIHIHPGR